jgi:CRP-like cAMP-binding protein
MTRTRIDRAAVRAAFERIAPIGEQAFAALEPLLGFRTFPKGAWLLEGGQLAEWCFLLSAGLVRELYLGDDGQEHTRRFIAEGQVTGSLLDLLSHKPSITWIQALEPVEAVAFRYADFDRLSRQFPEIAAVARHTAEALYVWKTVREYELLALPAAERYQRWLATNPALDRRVSRRHLASYLGVTPEHLSRLRQGSPPGARARRTAR